MRDERYEVNHLVKQRKCQTRWKYDGVGLSGREFKVTTKRASHATGDDQGNIRCRRRYVETFYKTKFVGKSA